MQIGFIGAGNMAQAMIKGLLEKKVVTKDDIVVNSKTLEKLNYIRDTYDVDVTLDKKEIIKYSDVIILAVKPNQIKDVISDISKHLRVFDTDKIFISVAAGVTIEQLEKYFYNNNILDREGMISFDYENDYHFKIVRAMPNMPAAVGAGMTGVSFNKNLKFSDIDKVIKIFDTIGKIEIVEEKLMDAVVALSGSSPAYIYMIIDAMADVAIAEGMNKDIAIKFASQAVLGSAKMVLETRKKPSVLKDEVCSPGGTTIEAVKVLENNDLSGNIKQAMLACIDKSKNM